MTTVIGLGHVGTVAAAGLASAGHDVLGVDVDRQRVAQLGTWTPPTDSGSADLCQVRSALSWTRGRAYEGLVVVMKSTVPPGTTA